MLEDCAASLTEGHTRPKPDVPSHRNTHTDEVQAVMAPQPVRCEHLHMALVRCPIALHPMTRASDKLHFHFTDPRTGHRVRMLTLDSETDEPLTHHDPVKGYKSSMNRYVLVDEEHLEEAWIAMSSAMTFGRCVDRHWIDPVWFDASDYVAPDRGAGQDVFVMLRDALQNSGYAALSRVMVVQRECTMAILPRRNSMVCRTLHDPRELHDPAPLFDAIRTKACGVEMVRLTGQPIERQSGTFTPEDAEDRYGTWLREVIDARFRGETRTPRAADEPRRDNVIDLMAAPEANLDGNERADWSTPSREAGTKAPGETPDTRKEPAMTEGRDGRTAFNQLVLRTLRTGSLGITCWHSGPLRYALRRRHA